MNKQQLEEYLQLYKEILKQVKDEVNKLYSKQEKLKYAEENIIKIRENTTQILNILLGTQERSINSLNKIMEIKHKANVSSALELNDLRIATGDANGNISLFSIDYETKQYNMNTEHKGHNAGVTSLCELSGNRLISSSPDKIIKVWKINDTLSLLNTLEGHNAPVNQVIPLSTNVIASAGSYDVTIQIWDVNEYKQLHILKEDFSVCSLLKLKNKKVMVSGGYEKRISFWNTKTFIKEHSIECCHCWSWNGLIELPNHYIAVNGGEATTIDIIDTERYKLFKRIECNDYIIKGGDVVSSLHMLNNGTFIYSHIGRFCQISSNDYNILFKTKMGDEFRGDTIISSSYGKYILTSNKKKGISIFRVEFI